MRICVLGDSHITSLKLSYDGLSEPLKKQIQATFFASRGVGLKALSADGGRLVSRDAAVAKDICFTSEGSGTIEAEHFDLFLIHSVGFCYPYPLFTECFYSQGFLMGTVQRFWEQRLFFYLYKELRKITQKPIVLSPQPYQSEMGSKTVTQVATSPTNAPDMEFFKACFANRLDGSVSFLMQPAETVVDTIFTAERYCVDALRLDVGDLTPENNKHPVRDYLHMNALYGDCVWRDFLRHNSDVFQILET